MPDSKQSPASAAPAAAKPFDEAAFDAAVSKPNGWSDVANPVAEIRRMRGDAQPGDAAALRDVMKEISVQCLYVAEGISDEADYGRVTLMRIRDKIRAALSAEMAERDTRRELSSPGNAAAMREALEKIANMKFHLGDFAEPVNGDSSAIYENAKWDGKKFLGREIPAWWGAGWRECLSRAIDIARAALAAPARNCDRFATAEGAMEEWEKYPQSRYKGCRVCPHGYISMVSPSHLTLAEWLFAPAEGGDHA